MVKNELRFHFYPHPFMRHHKSHISKTKAILVLLYFNVTINVVCSVAKDSHMKFLEILCLSLMFMFAKNLCLVADFELFLCVVSKSSVGIRTSIHCGFPTRIKFYSVVCGLCVSLKSLLHPIQIERTKSSEFPLAAC